ncbi:MAG: kinase [Pseudoxanthomonas spadix]|nr:MAG: kinase [Pseudoxanthomonas spadix]
MNESSKAAAAVAVLPEKYQPVFGHPGLSKGSSRRCEDRLALIRKCAKVLQDEIGRPLRILDLGCAQGFFSLSLAADGHRVHGVDFLELNINVCNVLASEHPSFHASFQHCTLEQVVERLEPEEYDLVLGLSVFHHLVHDQGLEKGIQACALLSKKVGAGIFELAVREEPLYWASSLPRDPLQLLEGYAFTRLLATQSTHLSQVSRPLVFASSRYWYVDQTIGSFVAWSAQSHARSEDTHQQSRRYYFGERVFVKKMTLGLGGRATVNKLEFHNEVEFLRDPPSGFDAPKLLVEADDGSDLYLVRELVRGHLLSEMIDEGVPYDAELIIDAVLRQLTVLERRGLYHSDVRCWNILMREGRSPVLIDYGAISADARDCSWISNLMLAFVITVKEILERRIVPSAPVREPAIDFMAFPPRLRIAFTRLFLLDRSAWTFSQLLAYFEEPSDVYSEIPEWAGIFQQLQQCLADYSQRIGLMFQQSAADRANLIAKEKSLEATQWAAKASEEARNALEGDLAAVTQRYLASSTRVAELEDEKATLARHIDGLKAELQGYSGVRETAERLAADNACLERKHTALARELEEARASYDGLLEASTHLEIDVFRLARERDDLSLELSVARDAMSRADAKSKEIEAELASLKNKLERAEEEGRRNLRRLKGLRLDAATSTKRAELDRTRIRQLEAMAASLEEQLRTVYASSSWRITAPFRWFSIKVLKRGATAQVSKHRAEASAGQSLQDDLRRPGDVIIEKRLAALDQIGARVRKKRG